MKTLYINQPDFDLIIEKVNESMGFCGISVDATLISVLLDLVSAGKIPKRVEVDSLHYEEPNFFLNKDNDKVEVESFIVLDKNKVLRLASALYIFPDDVIFGCVSSGNVYVFNEPFRISNQSYIWLEISSVIQSFCNRHVMMRLVK